MAVPLIAGVAILHGLRIVGLRIIPYLVREGTRVAAKQAAKKVAKEAPKKFGSLKFQPVWKRNIWTGGSDLVTPPVQSVATKTVAKEAIKKVGAKKITETGYIVVVKDPKKFKLAEKIFNTRTETRVFKSDIISAQSTSSRTYEHITKESLKKIKDSDIRRTIASQADDAANNVSKFIIQSPSRVTSGESVIAPFNKFYGQNIKFTDKTLKNIKLAEQGPTALGKDIVTTGVAKKTAEKTPKFLREFTGKKTLKTPDVIAIGSGKVKTPSRVSIKGKEPVPVRELPTERPWYVAIVPPWLRTSTRTVQTKDMVGVPLNPYLAKTTEGLNVGRTIGTATGLSVAAPLIKSGLTPSDRPEKRITTELNIDQLFGDTTGPLERTQLDVPQSVEIFDD
jgi:hypothetical protein